MKLVMSVGTFLLGWFPILEYYFLANTQAIQLKSAFSVGASVWGAECMVQFSIFEKYPFAKETM
mgnify:CR=1 FL=1